MGGDLGTGGNEVHAREVLAFWFGQVPPEKHFAPDDALDREIARRFGPMRDAVLVSRAEGWSETPDMILAAIILLDQFSRNLHRDKAEAFASDWLALGLARQAIERGWDVLLDPDRRTFLYMPLMHAEDREAQAESLACFATLGDADNLRSAREHAATIERFGRFPSRNAALARRSTPEEQVYLSQRDAGW